MHGESFKDTGNEKAEKARGEQVVDRSGRGKERGSGLFVSRTKKGKLTRVA